MAPKQDDTLKRKAAEAPQEEPAAKEAKKEEEEELEKDDKPNKKPTMKGEVDFAVDDLTLNAIPAMKGKALSSLTEAGLGYLIAGARANVGVKAGRYVYEVKVLESTMPAGVWGKVANALKPVMRIGFSTAGSSLMLGDGAAEQVFFDFDGHYFASSKRESSVSKRILRDSTAAIVLNLDASSPNANTVSLFVDGVRASPPMKLPECLNGKPLYPHICFRSFKVQLNWLTPHSKLPFTCRGIGKATATDVAVKKIETPKEKSCEVVFPVCYPDQGTFDWAELFLKEHPDYYELSDRKFLDWAISSGLPSKWRPCNDRPPFNFNLPGADDNSIQRILNVAAPLVPRNYVVMEVKGNLLQQEREANLKRFSLPCYKKVAYVMMGEPSDDFKEAQQEKLLREKQDKVTLEWKSKKVLKQRQKEQAKLLELKKKQLEEAKKAKEGNKEEKAEEKKEEGEKKEEEETKAEEKKEESDEEMEPPTAELDEKEKSTWFLPKAIPDLAANTFDISCPSFTLPKASEGFDEIKYEWQGEEECEEFLQKMIKERKKTTKIAGLTPGEYFKKLMEKFNESLAEWQTKQQTWRNSDAGKAAAAAAEDSTEVQDAKEVDDVKDIHDMGKGEPLYKDFSPEDWACYQLRAELLFLIWSFPKDAEDPDRKIPEAHISFYYAKYFNKNPNLPGYGVESITELIELVGDVAAIKDGFLVADEKMEEQNLEAIVKATEASRRSRQSRLNAGDETARLGVAPDAAQPAGLVPTVNATMGALVPTMGGPMGTMGSGPNMGGMGGMGGMGSGPTGGPLTPMGGGPGGMGGCSSSPPPPPSGGLRPTMGGNMGMGMGMGGNMGGNMGCGGGMGGNMGCGNMGGNMGCGGGMGGNMGGNMGCGGGNMGCGGGMGGNMGCGGGMRGNMGCGGGMGGNMGCGGMGQMGGNMGGMGCMGGHHQMGMKGGFKGGGKGMMHNQWQQW